MIYHVPLTWVLKLQPLPKSCTLAFHNLYLNHIKPEEVELERGIEGILKEKATFPQHRVRADHKEEEGFLQRRPLHKVRADHKEEEGYRWQILQLVGGQIAEQESSQNTLRITTLDVVWIAEVEHMNSQQRDWISV